MRMSRTSRTEPHRATMRAMLAAMRPVGARYVDGQLKPDRPLPLQPGERVGVILVRRPDPARWDLRRIAAASRGEDAELAAAGMNGWADELDAEDRR